MITDNTARSRYELSVDGQVAFANYRKKDGVMAIDYVEAPPALRGTGVAGRLMDGVMDAARRENLKVMPICSYAVSWIRRHPDVHDLVA